MFKEATLMNEFIDKENPVAGPVVNEIKHGSSTFSTGQLAQHDKVVSKNRGRYTKAVRIPYMKM